MDLKKVTIITPCFNSEKTIEKTLNCMLNQTYQNYEYIIVDGKSSDKTLEIIKNYEPLFKGKMKHISEKDNGIYDAMNKGIKMASGELIGIVNSDDYYEIDAIENIVGSMTNDKYQIIYGFQRCIKHGKEIRTVIYHHDNLDNQMITHPTCFITKSVYDDYGLYDTSLKSSSDYKFMLDVYHKGGVKFTPVYKIISNFSLDGVSGSQIGYRETLKLRLSYKNISKKKYHYLMIRSRLHDLKQKIMR